MILETNLEKSAKVKNYHPVKIKNVHYKSKVNAVSKEKPFEEIKNKDVTMYQERITVNDRPPERMDIDNNQEDPKA